VAEATTQKSAYFFRRLFSLSAFDFYGVAGEIKSRKVAKTLNMHAFDFSSRISNLKFQISKQPKFKTAQAEARADKSTGGVKP